MGSRCTVLPILNLNDKWEWGGQFQALATLIWEGDPVLTVYEAQWPPPVFEPQTVQAIASEYAMYR